MLASTSIYRRELLTRLQLPFAVAAPDVDETALPGEAPQATALRLAVAKAKAVAAQYPAALIIGSDQVAVLDGLQIGKPYTHDNAAKQLKMMRGKAVLFHTALCLYNSANGKVQKQAVQMQMFSIDDPVLVKIRDTLNNLDVNTLTPVEALMKLDEIQRVIKG